METENGRSTVERLRRAYPCLVCGADPVVITAQIQLCSLHARAWAESELPFGVWKKEAHWGGMAR